MEYSDLLRQFELFFSEIYYKNLLNAAKESGPVVIDFIDLEKFNPDVADYLLEHPEDCIKAAKEAVSNIDLGADSSKIFVRFKNLPKSRVVKIRDLRSTHIGKFIAIEGLIRQASEVRPEITAATWECLACGERIILLQDSAALNKPFMCECGNKRAFDLVSRKLIDVQLIVVEESPETLEGGQQTRKIKVYLRNDLVDPNFQKKVTPGNKVIVTGIVNDTPIISRFEKESKTRDIYIEGNWLESIQVEFEEVELNEEDIKEIKRLSKDPNIYEMFTKSIAPSIYGYEVIKEAIALQLFSGVPKVRPDGIKVRGDSHILLVGDPGAGKSAILKYVADLAPKGRYIVGKMASGAGLTAAAVKDEFTGGWALEAGAIVLANNGLASIDEIDKMSEQDRGAMHEGMEQQTITVSKANIQATLLCKTIVLAAANPKFGRFDLFTPVVDQINIPETLLSRFDLIFAIKDIPNVEKDKRLAEYILDLHQNPELENPPLSKEMIRRYVSYARRNIQPVLTNAASDRIQDFYVMLREKSAGMENPTVGLTPRQLEALVRLAEASAKVRLSNKVTKEDAERAVKLLSYCLQQVGTDVETGQVDIDRFGGTPTKQRNKMMEILRIFRELEKESEIKEVDKRDLIARATDEGFEEKETEEILSKLKESGEFYEKRAGFLKKV